ncbi:2-hydroxyacid dehydrogenase [Actinopolymorpha alba]|uniref:2-hydroxyacid dehydrogenase n=1 Tax=Actinopolymorpha alba TaxID=533267 RepID=UPI000373337B|nr:2-hydroxyacid dehydrogenase [Actinopolymorpha alba]
MGAATGVSPAGAVRVWLPEPPAVYDGLPEGLQIDVYDGAGEPPASLADVEFYVPPYMSGPHTVELITRMPRLKVVQTLTAGVENLRPYLRAGVTLCNARGVHDASTAELGVALILASLRGFPDFVRAQDEGRWAAGRRQALADSRVLIVGAGSIGQALARRLAPFECEVVMVARTGRDGGVAGMDRLPELLPTADVVVLLVPMTDETRGLVDAKFLAQLKDGALVVNIARGPVVDTDALLAELTSGRIQAALDVTDPEPLPVDHPLWSAPGLLISPHVGGNTSAFVPRGRRLVSAQLRRYVAGEPLANVVDGAY